METAIPSDALHPDIRRLHKIGQAIEKVEGGLPVLDRNEHQDAWNAWLQWRKDRGISCHYMDRADRWTVVSVWPPVDLDEFEAEWNVKGRGGLSRGTLDRLS